MAFLIRLVCFKEDKEDDEALQVHPPAFHPQCASVQVNPYHTSIRLMIDFVHLAHIKYKKEA
jgi:hypothetical protein